MTMYEQESVHDAVGAYVLGILDDADASAFEAHLAGCDICATHLEEFSGMEPMLAMLAEAPAPARPSNVLNMPGRHAMPGTEFPPSSPFPWCPRRPAPSCSADCSTRSRPSGRRSAGAGCTWSRPPRR